MGKPNRQLSDKIIVVWDESYDPSSGSVSFEPVLFTDNVKTATDCAMGLDLAFRSVIVRVYEKENMVYGDYDTILELRQYLGKRQVKYGEKGEWQTL